MKKNILVSLLILAGITVSQYSQSATGQGSAPNYVDANGLKQGHWIILNKTAKLPGYTDDQKVEEGNFTDSKKQGIWEQYYPSGFTKNKLTYKDNVPNGYAIMYNDSGKISEEGLWQNHRWVGDYKLYYNNGKVEQEFKFNTMGKREGEQKYYYPNGQVMMDGNWNGGKENGTLKEYYDNGQIKAEKPFVNGNLDAANTKEYQPTKPITVVKDNPPATSAPKVVVKADEKPNLPTQVFTGEGYFKLYNRNKQIAKDGNFVHGVLKDGKCYYYSNDGILSRIAVYKSGVYIGDAPIDDKTK
ncbi:MAG: toxin-antitoxin system YwqK family antitoxin [Bacteroidia bacterium]